MVSDTRTTRQLLEALGFRYSQGDHDSLVRAALRELEQRRAVEQGALRNWNDVIRPADIAGFNPALLHDGEQRQ